MKSLKNELKTSKPRLFYISPERVDIIAEVFFLLYDTSMVITAKNYKETDIKIFKSFRFYLISLAQSIYSWIVVYL